MHFNVTMKFDREPPWTNCSSWDGETYSKHQGVLETLSLKVKNTIQSSLSHPHPAFHHVITTKTTTSFKWITSMKKRERKMLHYLIFCEWSFLLFKFRSHFVCHSNHFFCLEKKKVEDNNNYCCKESTKEFRAGDDFFSCSKDMMGILWRLTTFGFGCGQF